MATPIENAQLLHAYWLALPGLMTKVRAAGPVAGVFIAEVRNAVWRAQAAMKELIAQCSNNEHARTTVFAKQFVFSDCLLNEANRGTDEAIRVIGLYPEGKLSPREIMLAGIYKAGTGGLFNAQDPTGLTSWLGSVDVTLAGVTLTVGNDPSPDVRAALLRILNDMGLPKAWVAQGKPAVPGAQPPPTMLLVALNRLIAELPTQAWSQAQRGALLKLAGEVKGRVETFGIELLAASSAASAADATWAAVEMGDGQIEKTTPPRAKPWYKNGAVMSSGFVGLVGGALWARSNR